MGSRSLLAILSTRPFGGFFFGVSNMKHFLIWAGILASLLGPANAAGTVPGFSLTPQFDTFGKVMPGCKLYVIQAGTTQTPQNSYQDSALTILQPNPLVCDATGRLPQWFVADGQIKVRLTNAAGSQQFIGDNLLVVGSSSGGGGGGSVDPTTIIATGDFKSRYGTGVLTGFVRANGRTIGSATSGATERANADSQALFEYLWTADSNLVVSTGRGASANADWVANKTITLPDYRGVVMGGLADMGNTPTPNLTATYCGNNPTVLGAGCGSQLTTLLQSDLPNVGLSLSASGAISVTSAANNIVQGGVISIQNGNGANVVGLSTGSGVGPITSSGSAFVSGSTSSINGAVGQSVLSRIPPTRLLTFYIKL